MKGFIPLLMLLFALSSCANQTIPKIDAGPTDVGWQELCKVADPSETYECKILPALTHDTVPYVLVSCETTTERTEADGKFVSTSFMSCDTLWGPLYSSPCQLYVYQKGSRTPSYVTGVIYAPFTTPCIANCKFVQLRTRKSDPPTVAPLFWYADNTIPACYEHQNSIDNAWPGQTP